MNENGLDQLLRDAAHTYNAPPAAPPYEEMWQSIEAARSEKPLAAALDGRRATVLHPRGRWPFNPGWLRYAASLVLGVALGRISISITSPRSIEVPAVVQEELAGSTEVPEQYQQVTGHYLGETAALLIALPGELNAARSDAAFVARANELLFQTRLLLDSPAAADPALRALFEDLEVVLVQVVRLPADRDPTRIDVLNDALQQRDVMPRLRSAVVHHIAD